MQKNLSYADGDTSVPLLEVTIGDLFDQITEKYGENDALIVVHQGLKWTYNDLKKRVDACAKALITQGVEKGDRDALNL